MISHVRVLDLNPNQLEQIHTLLTQVNKPEAQFESHTQKWIQIAKERRIKRPADPKGERSGENFSRENTEKSRKESKEHRSTSFKEDGVR